MYNGLLSTQQPAYSCTSCNDELVAVMHSQVQMPEALQWLKARYPSQMFRQVIQAGEHGADVS